MGLFCYIGVFIYILIRIIFTAIDGDTPFDDFKRINAYWESLFDEFIAFVHFSSNNFCV